MHIRSDVARRPPMQVARQIAALANLTAPFGETRDSAGRFAEKRQRSRKGQKKGSGAHLKGSFHAEAAGNIRIGTAFGNRRAYAVVASDVDHAAVNEFGRGVGNEDAGRHTLRNAGQAILRSQPGLGNFRIARSEDGETK